MIAAIRTICTFHLKISQLTFTCSNSITETLEKGVKYVQTIEALERKRCEIYSKLTIKTAERRHLYYIRYTLY